MWSSEHGDTWPQRTTRTPSPQSLLRSNNPNNPSNPSNPGNPGNPLASVSIDTNNALVS